MPGDLGLLGSASLDATQIESLLNLVATGKEVEKVVTSASANNSTTHHRSGGDAVPLARQANKSRSKGRQTMGNRSVVGGQKHGTDWSPLGKRQRRHLELCSRLLRCSQRMFLADAEEDTVGLSSTSLLGDDDDDDDEEHDDLGDNDYFPGNYSEPLTSAFLEDLSNCPWVIGVARHLWYFAPITLLQPSASIGDKASIDSADQKSSISDGVSTQSTSDSILEMIPLLKVMLKVQASENMPSESSSSVVPFLQIICSCAEAFPGGECWTTSTYKNWTKVPMVDQDKGKDEWCYQNSSSPSDLAFVIYVVSTVLEQYGGPGGDSTVQLWVLLSLLKLVESTAIMFAAENFDPSMASILTFVWRKVWTTLFRSDLRYASYTSDTYPGSLGELVILLLTEIVDKKCTDPAANESGSSDEEYDQHQQASSSFLYQNQAHIWGLPIFLDAHSIKSSCAFEMTCKVLQRSGLSEIGQDNIDSRPPPGVLGLSTNDATFNNGTTRDLGRRYRLCCFIMQFIGFHCSVEKSNASIRSILPSACSCICSLISGANFLFITTFGVEGLGRFRCTQDTELDLVSVPLDDDHSCCWHNELWKDSMFADHPHHDDIICEEIQSSLTMHIKLFNTQTGGCRKAPWKDTVSHENSADFVSPSTMRVFQDIFGGYVHQHLQQRYPSPRSSEALEQNWQQDDEQGVDSSALSRRTVLFKCFLMIKLSGYTTTSTIFDVIGNMPEVLSFFEDVTDRLPALSTRRDEFYFVTIHLLGIFRAFATWSSYECNLRLPGHVYDQLSSVVNVCKEMLNRYPDRLELRHSTEAGSSPASNTMARKKQKAILDFSDDDEEAYGSDDVGIHDKHSSFENESDINSDGHTQRKRKGGGIYVGAKRQRSTKSNFTKDSSLSDDSSEKRDSQMGGCPPDSICARLLATILFISEPSGNCCRAIADVLIWPSEEDAKELKDHTQNEQIVNDAIFCVKLFSHHSAILRRQRMHKRKEHAITDFKTSSSSQEEEESMISLCCDVISAIRSFASPGSPAQLFGFQICSTLVKIVESHMNEDAMAKTECEDILIILDPEGADTGDRNELRRARRTLRNCPEIRVDQLNAATFCFRHGSQTFHSLFDTKFAMTFVVPSLSDLSHNIRYRAAIAVGDALRLLPDQQKIVESIRKVIPPMASCSKSQTDLFELWVNDRTESLTDTAAMESLAWMDSRSSLDYHFASCLGVIAGRTCDDSIFRKTLMELIDLSQNNPERQLVFFQACELAASLRGFQNVEGMIKSECVWLLQQWLSSGRSLGSIPIILCAPNFFRKVLLNGKAILLGSLTRTEGYVDSGLQSASDTRRKNRRTEIEDSIENARQQFLEKNAGLLIPLILLSGKGGKYQARSSSDDEHDIEPKKVDKRWEYLLEISHALVDDRSDSAIANILRAHLHDIYGFVFPCLHHNGSAAVSEHFREEGVEALAFLKSLLSEDIIAREGAKKADLVVRKSLYLYGRQVALHERAPFHHSAYIGAIRYIGTEINRNATTEGSIFQDAGSSTIECLLHCRSWLDKCIRKNEKVSFWGVISLICDQVLLNLKDSTSSKAEFKFCLHILLNLALDQNLHEVRPLIFEQIKEMIGSASRRGIELSPQNSEDRYIHSMLVGTLIELHEQYQLQFIDRCLKLWRNERRHLKQSVGLLSNRGDVIEYEESLQMHVLCNPATDRNNEGAIDPNLSMAIGDFGGFISQDIIDGMSNTFDLLEIALEWTPDNESGIIHTETYNKRRQEILVNHHVKYCAQALLEKDEPGDCGDFEMQFEAFLQLFQQHPISRSISKKYTKNAQKQHDYGRFSSLEREDDCYVNIDLRFQLAGLRNLERVLRQCRLDKSRVCQQPVDSAPSKVFSLLYGLCGSNAPRSIRLAASGCLGEMVNINFLYMLQPNSSNNGSLGTSVAEVLDPIMKSKIAALKLLSSYIRSPRIRISLVAMETAKAILSTREGTDILNTVKDKSIRETLTPFIGLKDITKKNSLTVSNCFRARIISSNGIDPKVAMHDRMWCWSKKLWQCVEERESSHYEKWVKRLVCSLICCCYSEEKIGSENTASSYVRGSGTFFAICHKMCFVDHEFGAAIFPGIIFDILESTERPSSSKKCDSIRDAVLQETAIGTPDALSNRCISQSFHSLLRPENTYTRDEDTAPAKTDSRALTLIIDTLDELRRVTERRFLSSTQHRRNPGSLPNRVYPDQQTGSARSSPLPNEREYNSGLSPAPLWRGIPYGVVLRLNGIDIANACIQTKRFSSALYFAEMFADNCLGGSGGCLERLSCVDANPGRGTHSMIHDISGFGMKDTDQEHGARIGTAKFKDALASALAIQSVMKECLSNLNESDGLAAVESQGSAIRFTSNRSQTTETDCSMTTTEKLQALDMHLLLAPSKAASRSDSLALAGYLDRLGLRYVLQSYIGGLANTGIMRIDEGKGMQNSHSEIQRDLAEITFQGKWRALQWDNSLLMKDSVSNQSMITGENTTPPTQPNSQSNIRKEAPLFSEEILTLDVKKEKVFMGFHESLSKAFFTFLQDDMDTYAYYILRARDALLNQMSVMTGEEAVPTRIHTFASKLQLLNDLRDLRPMSNESSITSIVERWRVDLDFLRKKDDRVLYEHSLSGAPFDDAQELILSVQEVVLKMLHQTKSNSEVVFDPTAALASHLWKFCSTALHHDRPDIANASLKRLGCVLAFQDQGKPDARIAFEKSMLVRFEEAKILWNRGDFTGAIRNSKLVISCLKQRDQTNTQDILLAECMSSCGQWMAEHKIESATSILNNFLKPASDIAQKVYEQEGSNINAKQMTSAHLILAELVSTLYDGVSSRVKSQEWKKSGSAVDARSRELSKCQEMYEEVKTKLREIQSKKKSGGKGTKHRKTSTSNNQHKSVEDYTIEYQELHIYISQLRKEIDIAVGERTKIENSVDELLKQALESFGVALSISNTGEAEDLSKYVYRLMSLWFSNCHRVDDKFDANLIMTRLTERIPSFRFVPLTYQLFSRIDQDESSFQQSLRAIVSKICIEHPYHALVQLIALSNGNKVGSGVSGRQASTYLENVGDSKVEAAKGILARVKERGPIYLSSLIDSYSMLVDSYIYLAMAPTESFHTGARAQTKDISLSVVFKNSDTRNSSVSSLDRCFSSSRGNLSDSPPCVLTNPPVLRPSGDYGQGREDPVGGERIIGFDSTFSLTETGLHRPKIVICRGSKGGRFKQLVKGEDDIRQDAIMEQVFTYVNNLLRQVPHHKSATTQGVDSRRNSRVMPKLKVVTYNIIPLSPASGVLEWVDSTVPFGDYLLDKGRSRDKKTGSIGAHSKYYPGEWGNSLCRMHFRNAPSGAKREAYDQICKHFSPAFRFFFLERFSHSPEAWHAARMLYTRSSAVSSVVGHVLGIGDRHSHNILIHEKTGEVVHIDFGIVFEQGKVSKIILRLMP
eukprot:scaffold62915_cov55-Attheya_sp.AAC.3